MTGNFLKGLIGVVLLLSSALTFAEAGHYERIRVAGPSLEGNLSGDDSTRDVSVYLPPGYEDNPQRRYPVIYLLHGYTDSDSKWFGLNGEHFVNVQSAVDAAWENGAAEMIIVMPDAYTLYEGSMYSSSATTGDWEAFVAKDLVEYVDSHYRTLAQRNSRGLAGHSMGGYGTMRIGMKYADVFGALYAMSPCCMEFDMHPAREQFAAVADIKTMEDLKNANGFFAKAPFARSAAWAPNPDNPPFYVDMPYENGELQEEVVARLVANAPLIFVHQYIAQLKTYNAIHLDAGDRDTGIAATVEQMSEILSSYGVKHWSGIYPGDHISGIHERLTTHLLPMFSETLVQE